MELFCSKRMDNDATLEYKMCQSKAENGQLGSVNVYGFKVKYISPQEFSYCYAEDIAGKPQTVLQLIKYLFDNNVKPNEVYSKTEAFLGR